MNKPCTESNCISFENCNKYNSNKENCKGYTPDEFKIDKDEVVEIDKKTAESAGIDYEEWSKLMHQPVVVKSIQEDIEKDIVNYVKNKYGDYFDIKEFPKENDKHLKGYIFDSLVYRYKSIRDKLAMYEVPEYMAQFHCGKPEAECKSMQRANDDLLRFIRVLDEAIGEHD